jgi:hypothetical protein
LNLMVPSRPVVDVAAYVKLRAFSNGTRNVEVQPAPRMRTSISCMSAAIVMIFDVGCFLERVSWSWSLDDRAPPARGTELMTRIDDAAPPSDHILLPSRLPSARLRLGHKRQHCTIEGPEHELAKLTSQNHRNLSSIDHVIQSHNQATSQA